MIFSNHPATMWSRYWNSYYDCKVLETLSLATAATLLCEEPESDVSLSIQSLDSDWESENEDEDVVPMILTLSTLLQHSEVHKVIEDDTIHFNQRLLIVNFNEAQCLEHFRFRKNHLIELAEALWPRMLLYLPRDSHYDRIKCTNNYRCPFETAILIHEDSNLSRMIFLHVVKL